MHDVTIPWVTDTNLVQSEGWQQNGSTCYLISKQIESFPH